MPTTTIPFSMPVRTFTDALYLMARAAMTGPETLVFLLDADGMGGILLAIGNSIGPDHMLDVVEAMASGAERRPEVASMVVTSVRPDQGLLPGDIDRWLEASDRCRLRGIELLEWFVFGTSGPRCPRELLGEPSRFAA